MGLMGKFSKSAGDNESSPTAAIKGPLATLRELGIDTANLKFTLNRDGSVNITGHVRDRSECDRICQVINGIPGIGGVKNKLIVGAPEDGPEQTA